MKLFECQNCGQILYFENTRCERCGHVLGYLPESATLCALAPEVGGRWRLLAAPSRPDTAGPVDDRGRDRPLFRFCANAAHDACNWLVPADGPDAYCRACRLNRTVPDLRVPGNVVLWQRVETAKHRLVYGVLRLGLPLASRVEDPAGGLAFDFLAGSGAAFRDAPEVATGHRDGVITIDVAEADDAERERHRRDMAEPYRTVLGHFRHEIGHYYWDRLVRDGIWHDAFRQTFGDERRDYAAALRTHYADGPPAGWQERCISGYACAHPWEDFAETWAHYMHIVDTLETAAAFGLRIRPNAGSPAAPETVIAADPCSQHDFDALFAAWQPLTGAVNSLNHSMGQPDLYPFVLSPAVMGKLRFVHGLIHDDAGRTASGPEIARPLS